MLFGSAGGTSGQGHSGGLEHEDADYSGALYLRAIRIMLLAARGDRETLATELAAMRAAADADIDPDVRALVLQGAEAALLDGQAADALRDIDAALAEYEGSDETFLVAPLLVVGMHAAGDLADTGRAFRDTARVEEAKRAGERLLARARELEEAPAAAATTTPSVRAAIATTAAEALRLDGSPDAGLWPTAATAWDAVPMPFAAARARALAAEAHLLVRGPRDVAADLLRRGPRERDEPRGDAAA